MYLYILTVIKIKSKNKIPFFLKPILSFLVKWYERYVINKLACTITATDNIKSKLQNYSKNIISVKNYPELSRTKFDQQEIKKKEDSICYLGLLNESRGILQLLDVTNKAKANLELAGRFVDEEFKVKCESQDGWLHTNYYGMVDLSNSIEIMKSSKVGLMLHHPNRAYYNAIPIKLLEYMACGLPVIVSNYPICEELIGDLDCGYLVDVFDSEKIVTLINRLLNNPKLAEEMGARGRKAVFEKFNWSNEYSKILDAYKLFSY